MTTLRARRRSRFRFQSADRFFLFQPAQTDCWTPSASCLKGSGLAFFPRKQLGWDVRLTTHFNVVSMLICLDLTPLLTCLPGGELYEAHVTLHSIAQQEGPNNRGSTRWRRGVEVGSGVPRGGGFNPPPEVLIKSNRTANWAENV
jgi:hypothetical protein